MKRVVCCVGILLFFIGIMPVMAHPGRTDSSGCHTCRTNCASWGLRNGEYHCHNGSSSSSSSGSSSSSSSSSSARQVSKVTYVYGCTDVNAYNYNPKATKDDGSCVAKKYGCMDKEAINYDASVNTNDDSCQYKKVIVLKEKIDFKTKYKNNDEMPAGKTKTVKQGEDGEKEVTYDAIVDKDGNVISKEEVSEKVIVEPVNKVVEKGTKEASPVFGIIWIICLVFVFSYAYSHKNVSLLLNNISNQNKYLRILLYLLYIILFFPVFVDIILIISYTFKNKKE